MQNTLIERKHFKLLTGIVIAGAIAGSLTLLQKRKETAPAPSPATASTSGNPAADRIHELTSLQEQLKQNPNHGPILFRMSQLASEMGKPEDAISYLRQLLKADPSNTEARLELGRLLYANNDIAGATTETAKILEKDPKQVDALYNLGAINANLGKLDTARDYWNRAVSSGPDSESGHKAKDGLQKLGPANAVVQAGSMPAGWKHPPIPSPATHPSN